MLATNVTSRTHERIRVGEGSRMGSAAREHRRVDGGESSGGEERLTDGRLR